jgi:hypothetical protein
MRFWQYGKIERLGGRERRREASEDSILRECDRGGFGQIRVRGPRHGTALRCDDIARFESTPHQPERRGRIEAIA